jgi:hypothetical protein
MVSAALAPRPRICARERATESKGFNIEMHRMDEIQNRRVEPKFKSKQAEACSTFYRMLYFLE